MGVLGGAGVEAVGDECVGGGAHGAAVSGDIDKGLAVASGDLLGYGVEGVDLAGDLVRVPAVEGGKGGYAPARYRQYEDMGGGGGETDGQLQQLFELRCVYGGGTSTVLVVDADEEGDEIIAGEEPGALQRRWRVRRWSSLCGR